MTRCCLPLLLLAACTARVAPPPAPPADTAGWYRQAAAGGTAVYAIVPEQSLLVVSVRRAGPMAHLGHDHVIASRALAGFAAPAAGRADAQFRPDQMSVDEPALLREAGLGPQPPAEAVAGTRTNMLTRVLDADRFPVIRLHAERASADVLRVSITLHGFTRTVDVPAVVAQTPATVSATGAVQLRQTDFGITPLSVGAGLLSVQDAIDVRFRIVGRRW